MPTHLVSRQCWISSFKKLKANIKKCHHNLYKNSDLKPLFIIRSQTNYKYKKTLSFYFCPLASVVEIIFDQNQIPKESMKFTIYELLAAWISVQTLFSWLRVWNTFASIDRLVDSWISVVVFKSTTLVKRSTCLVFSRFLQPSINQVANIADFGGRANQCWISPETFCF